MLLFALIYQASDDKARRSAGVCVVLARWCSSDSKAPLLGWIQAPSTAEAFRPELVWRTPIAIGRTTTKRRREHDRELGLNVYKHVECPLHKVICNNFLSSWRTIAASVLPRWTEGNAPLVRCIVIGSMEVWQPCRV